MPSYQALGRRYEVTLQPLMRVLHEVGATDAVADDSGDRIVVKPASGDGADALKIANHVYEQARPAASSVRFLQFVPKPDLSR